MTPRDLVEVGRFVSYLGGERGAYSFTPHWWEERLRQRARWFWVGFRFWLSGPRSWPSARRWVTECVAWMLRKEGC